MNMDTINERRLERFRFLKYLYERTGGSEAEHVPHADIAQHVGLSQDQFRDAFQYLMHEGLINGTRGTVCLTHAGVVEIEAALSQPDQPTQHFPVNIIHIEQVSHSQIQQGTVGSTQSGTFVSLDLAAAAEFVGGLKTMLPQLGLTGDDEAVAKSDLATIETQLSSPRPKLEIIKESLRSIRNIAEGAVGSLAASGIMAGIAKLLGM
jgi:hypothetical protein